MDISNLISCVIVASSGISGKEAEIKRVAAELKTNFAFFEILIILPLEYRNSISSELQQALILLAPQTRAIVLDVPPHFDDMAVEGYKTALGDVIVVIDAEEIEGIPVMDLVAPLIKGNRLVRLKRDSYSLLAGFSSLVVKAVTGYQVDVSYCRSIAVNRQLLSEVLPSTERLVLFRFIMTHTSSGSTVLPTRMPPTKRGLRALLRRIDTVARLVMTTTPRLLRQAAMLCGILSLGSVLALVYVMANWIFNPAIIEGWATTNSLIATMMFVQMAAMTAVCLGISRMLDRGSDARVTRIVDEWSAGDLFGRSNLLNVETENRLERGTLPEASKVTLGVGSPKKNV